jgi:hypothetical protein
LKAYDLILLSDLRFICEPHGCKPSLKALQVF